MSVRKRELPDGYAQFLFEPLPRVQQLVLGFSERDLAEVRVAAAMAADLESLSNQLPQLVPRHVFLRAPSLDDVMRERRGASDHVS